jgi:hypothetical protein
MCCEDPVSDDVATTVNSAITAIDYNLSGMTTKGTKCKFDDRI